MPTLLEDLERAALEIDCVCAAGTECSKLKLAARLRAHAARLREEWNRWEGDMDGAGGVVARINGGPLQARPPSAGRVARHLEDLDSD